MTTPDKDTIYVDIDDEITGIIDKFKASKGKVVALVLPKRATVFQSIVNMKLLKRAADSTDKNLVLITSEAGLLPLAGAAGIHVAKTLNSRPEIPTAPLPFTDSDEAVDEDAELPVEDNSAALDKTAPVGKLAGDSAAVAASKDGVETLRLDNDEAAATTAAAGAAEASKPNKANKKDGKLKVPNFERFRLLLGIGALLLLLLIALFIYANSSLAKATINIATDATNVPTNLNLNLSTAASAVNVSNNTVPAKFDQQQKTFSQQVGTTGQRNNGNKAAGSVNMTAQECGTPQPAPDVPAGTGVSANGQTYITQQDTSFNPSSIKGGCINFNATSSTSIIAQSGGSSYNVSGVPFTVASRSDVSASGNASGGTDNTVQTVNQNDINNAKNKISAGNDATVKEALNSQLQGEGYYPLTVTYNVGTPTITSSANVGDVASNVTVTETITYTMFGVHKSDLKAVIDNNVNSQIDTNKQSILSEGLDGAIYNVNNLSSSGGVVTLSTKAVAGPQLNIDTIKKNAAGKKEGDIRSQLSSNPDVTNVSVSFSPFWVNSAPNNVSKITVKIAKPTTTKSGP